MAKHRLRNIGFSEEIIRYGFVAISSFTVDLLTLHILYRIYHVDYLQAVAIGFIAGAIWNYIWAVGWAFAYRRFDSRGAEIASYGLIVIIGFVANLAIMDWLRHVGVTQIVEARFISAILTAALSFGSKKLFLFTDYNVMNEIFTWYRGAPLSDRLHIIARRLTMPLTILLRHIPLEARDILEVGTGHGLVLMALANRRRTHNLHLYGTDIDPTKIAVAQQAAGHAKANMHFAVTDKLPPKNTWDAIIIADVLYLLSPREQQNLVRSCLRALRPGGTLLIKEMAFKPRWKLAWARWQEKLAVSRLKLTMRRGSGEFAYADLAELARTYDARGYHTQLVAADRGRLYPHQLLCIKK